MGHTCMILLTHVLACAQGKCQTRGASGQWIGKQKTTSTAVAGEEEEGDEAIEDVEEADAKGIGDGLRRPHRAHPQGIPADVSEVRPTHWSDIPRVRVAHLDKSNITEQCFVYLPQITQMIKHQMNWAKTV